MLMVNIQYSLLLQTILSGTVSDMDSAYLRSLQLYLKELLSLWFCVGFFSLERVTWQSPCDIVQKVGIQ